ncbi:hypothetical protein GQR58_024747 [Nymphon striatum]|nr:hypothetical protein GQR58_024747 [Nymphon striatum]
MSFTETWLKEIHQDDHVNIDGFKILRGDRTEESGRKGGGGVCLYINESYCHPNNSVIKSHSCSPNIEILTVSIRPYYLPREFSHIVMMTIYIPHQRVATQAAVELCQAIQHIESSAPNAFICINGDFNHCNLKKSGFKYHQHVTCPTRGQNTLDLCYTNVKDAYVASGLPKLGDHNLVLLKPKYRPLVQRQKPSLKTVRHFTHDTIQQLQGCLASTDWQVFIENTVDLNELTETIGDYINFCTDLTIPKKLVKIYSNNKPRITKNAKTVINRKKYIYKNGSKEELRAIQKQLKTVLQKDRVAYKIKIEKNFTENNMKQIWKGMRLMSGHSNGTYARAIRGHFLVDTALSSIVLGRAYDVNLSMVAEESYACKDFQEAADLLDKLLREDVSPDEVCSKDVFNRISEKLKAEKNFLAEHKMGKLRIQYMDMIDLLRRFLKALRMGDFLLYLGTLQEMLPYFAACGHNNYAK